jgi:dephospho-CoA kinase
MIISLSGRKGSGKTTLAQVCENPGYIILNFGDELKKLICKMLNITMDYLSENKNNSINNGNFYLKEYLDFFKDELNLTDNYSYLLEKKIKSYRE